MGTSEQEQQQRWKQWLDALAEYRDAHGHTDMPSTFVTSDGRKLGKWLAHCHRRHLQGRLPADLAADLIALGVDLSNRKRHFTTADEQTWQRRLDAVRAYRDEYGHTRIPHNYRSPDGDKLGNWLIRVRSEAHVAKLPADRIELLRAAGVEIRDPELPPIEQERSFALARDSMMP